VIRDTAYHIFYTYNNNNNTRKSTTAATTIKMLVGHTCKMMMLLTLVSSAAVAVAAVEEDETMTLSSLSYLDAIRRDPNTTVTRTGNVDILTVEEDGVEKEIGLCHLPFIYPFSLPPGAAGPVRVPFNVWKLHQGFVSVFLAMQHLNTGDGRVIPEVEGLNERCNLRFTTESFDTILSENVAVNHALDVMDRDPNGNLPSPCMFLGAARSTSSIAMSIVTGLDKYPMFSAISQSVALDNKEQHKYFGRHCPSQAGTVIPLIKFYRNVLGVTHLGVVHANDDYGNSVRY
jgi:hypothetical protein